jgi:hypothetical protein
MRAYPATSGQVEKLLKDPTLPVPFVASTEGKKKDGKNLRADDWLLDRFNTKYSIILFAHDYRGELALPVGTGQARVGDDAKLRIEVLYDVDDPFAMKVRSKAIKGMMAASVGWEEVRQGNALKNELVELSMVPVPLDLDALPDVQRMNFRALRDDLSNMLGENGATILPPLTQNAAGKYELSAEFKQALLALVQATPGGEPDLSDGERAGAAISARNMADLKEACRLVQGVIDRAAKMPPMEEDEEMMGGRGDEEARRLLEEILNKLEI